MHLKFHNIMIISSYLKTTISPPFIYSNYSNNI